ncbi:MAG TPA: hypothetical protein VM118_07120, partial [Acidobacteriota bacterium]|nr:hypothetical protein [Acidobacteriota bacterium]
MPIARTIAVGLALSLLAPFALGQDAEREALADRWNRRLTGKLLVMVRQAPNRTIPKGYGHFRWLDDHPASIAALDLRTGRLDVIVGSREGFRVTHQNEYQWGQSSDQICFSAFTQQGVGIFGHERERGDSRLLISGLAGRVNETSFSAEPKSFEFNPTEDILYVAMRFQIYSYLLKPRDQERQVPEWVNARVQRHIEEADSDCVDLMAVGLDGKVELVTELMDISGKDYRISPSGDVVAHNTLGIMGWPSRNYLVDGHMAPYVSHELWNSNVSRVEILSLQSGGISRPLSPVGGVVYRDLRFSADGNAFAAIYR